MSAGLLWLSSPVPHEHEWRFSSTSFRRIVYRSAGTLGARLPEPVLSPIIAAFVRELASRQGSILDICRILLSEVDVEAIVDIRSEQSGQDSSQVGRLLQDLKDQLLLLDREVNRLVQRGDLDGDMHLTADELLALLAGDSLRVPNQLRSTVVLQPAQPNTTALTTARTLALASVILALERVSSSLSSQARRGREILRTLDANDDEILTIGEIMGYKSNVTNASDRDSPLDWLSGLSIFRISEAELPPIVGLAVAGAWSIGTGVLRTLQALEESCGAGLVTRAIIRALTFNNLFTRSRNSVEVPHRHPQVHESDT